mmetsp:Transcript_16117/g.54778  ORF Transcript_16117/g.54778 Transcript_16117/m.54778 type:complete len:206 (-) Transcript_16117:236-853(-)
MPSLIMAVSMSSGTSASSARRRRRSAMMGRVILSSKQRTSRSMLHLFMEKPKTMSSPIVLEWVDTMSAQRFSCSSPSEEKSKLIAKWQKHRNVSSPNTSDTSTASFPVARWSTSWRSAARVFALIMPMMRSIVTLERWKYLASSARSWRCFSPSEVTRPLPNASAKLSVYSGPFPKLRPVSDSTVRAPLGSVITRMGLVRPQMSV